MRNRKVRDLAQSEEDSLEATSTSGDGGKTSTSGGSSCPFSLSGQSLGTVPKSSGLQVINKEEAEEDEQRQHQRQKHQLQQYQQQQQQQEEDKPQDQVRAQLISMHRAIGGADAPREEEATPEPATTATTTNTNRCAKCNKKLGLTGGFPCRCGGVYCAVHRYSDRHDCNFDYRELGASEIRRDNPLIVPSKLKKL